MTVLRRLFRYLAPYWKQLVLTATLLILLTIFELLPPLFQKQIVDEVIGARDLGRLGVLIGGLSRQQIRATSTSAMPWANVSSSICGYGSTPTCNACPSPSSSGPPPAN